jgi:hypothetical protein
VSFRHIDPPLGVLDLMQKAFALMSNKHQKYMAGKPITMHQIKQIIELLSKNYGVRWSFRAK